MLFHFLLQHRLFCDTIKVGHCLGPLHDTTLMSWTLIRNVWNNFYAHYYVTLSYKIWYVLVSFTFPLLCDDWLAQTVD